MPLLVAIHQWKKEDFPVVSKKVIEALQRLPEDLCLCASYVDVEQTGAWCVWEAKSPKRVKDFLTEQVPEMKTEVKRVLQFSPPSPDLYALIHTLVT